MRKRAFLPTGRSKRADHCAVQILVVRIDLRCVTAKGDDLRPLLLRYKKRDKVMDSAHIHRAVVAANRDSPCFARGERKEITLVEFNSLCQEIAAAQPVRLLLRLLAKRLKNAYLM